jgi:hypothetical protein
MFRPPHPDWVIAEIAEGQHGVVSRVQLHAAGVSDEMIATRVAMRRLYRLHDGVFSLTRQPGQRGLFMAAHLGTGGLVSDRSAVALWDLRAQSSGPVHVTVPRGCGGRRRGVRTHRTRRLEPDDCSRLDGIPCTSWPRTIVDIAGSSRERDLRRLLERSQVLNLFDAARLHAALERANGRRGTGGLRRLLTELEDDPAPTRSELERRFLDLVKDASLPSPITNGLVSGHEVDFHWPAARLIVETDGRGTHDNPLAFERDRQRDLELTLAGWHVIRISWRQLRDEPERIVALLRAKLR